MGRLSDHLLAHPGPTAEWGPLAFLVSLWHRASLRALEAKSSQENVTALCWRSRKPCLGWAAGPSLVRKAALGASQPPALGTSALSLSIC